MRAKGNGWSYSIARAPVVGVGRRHLISNHLHPRPGFSRVPDDVGAIEYRDTRRIAVVFPIDFAPGVVGESVEVELFTRVGVVHVDPFALHVVDGVLNRPLPHS